MAISGFFAKRPLATGDNGYTVTGEFNMPKIDINREQFVLPETAENAC